MKTYHLPVVVELDEDEYFIVSCPAYKGCHSYGKTIDEALENLKEVVAMCIEEQPSENLNKFIGIREMEFKFSPGIIGFIVIRINGSHHRLNILTEELQLFLLIKMIRYQKVC